MVYIPRFSQGLNMTDKSWIDNFVDYTDNTEPPVLFRKWTAMSVVAGALQRKAYLNWGTFNLYPNIILHNLKEAKSNY